MRALPFGGVVAYVRNFECVSRTGLSVRGDYMRAVSRAGGEASGRSADGNDFKSCEDGAGGARQRLRAMPSVWSGARAESREEDRGFSAGTAARTDLHDLSQCDARRRAGGRLQSDQPCGAAGAERVRTEERREIVVRNLPQSARSVRAIGGVLPGEVPFLPHGAVPCRASRKGQ